MQKRLSLALAAALLFTPALAQGTGSSTQTSTPAVSTISKNTGSTNRAGTRSAHHPMTLHRAAVDVNTATLAQLERIPGMTPRLAREVLLARAKGPFKNDLDLMRRVKGIGPQTLKKVAPYLKFA
ncbi:helix-hairpin-helix domain-containing protein [Deinococcus sp. S9]|uniref:ComEA family DNA-binding protein n=1 Tax=Deinococcus sp. S9 TaxID=2545754 RepID=UPI0010568BC8|nr:helix-hairpin-helix domain-containing protein [Deinococcus sp. S9]TDE87472.1 helix-hairpin-helix domain-containing protein [Deinococcus sp. S9]